jgi:hypothetical protein
MALVFPSNPAVGDTYQGWIWDGSKWTCGPHVLVVGSTRFNVATGMLEYWNGSAWVPITPKELVITTTIFGTESVGSNTYNPPPGLIYAQVEIMGAGGGGGSCSGEPGAVQAGGGGGSGAYCTTVLSAAQIGSSQPVIIGSGGGAQASGQATYFGSSSNPLLSAAPGGGGEGYDGIGLFGRPGIGGTGGSAVNPGVLLSGSGGTGGVTFQSRAGTWTAAGGLGGPGVLGAGSPPQVFAVGGGGNNGAIGTDGSGGGAAAGISSGPLAGGTGGNGYCFVTEFSLR